jgi:hypothetical protein
LIIFVIVLGVVFFLYASNYYNTVIGWAGVVLIVGGIVLGIVLKALGFLRKRRE